MKIELGVQDINQNVDKEKTAYSNPSQKDTARTAETTSGYSLDISGTVTDNAAYGTGDLKSAKDIMQDAGQKDIALQRDYMAVMSNSMSTEDFAELEKDGYSPLNTEIETQVTVVDKIKATLAEAGVVVTGYNDDLSSEQLTEITGSTGRADQIEKTLRENDLPVTEDNIRQMDAVLTQAENIRPLSDDAVKYMLNNKLEPTIGNLYKAEYSAGNDSGKQARGFYQDDTAGYYAKKADTVEWEQIEKQVESIVEKAGLPADEQTMDNARWAVEKGVLLTQDTLVRMDEIKSISIPLEETQLLSAMATAITDGRSPEQASLVQTESIAKQAVSLVNDVAAISDEAVRQVVTNDDELTIRNLKEYDRQIGEAQSEETGSLTEESNSDSLVSAKLFLEETRLQMTVEANIRLLKKGISVDTTSLEKLVEELKTAEQEYYQPLLGNESDDQSETENSTLSGKISLYKETDSLLSQIGSVPAAVLGKLTAENRTLTLSTVYEEGSTLKSTYEKAGQTYEALMTAPRADMGDSIEKAFQNTDELLDEMDLETTEANRRAVRILGYSNTQIDRDSVETVRLADQAVTNVIEKMTPAKTLQMIRDGENPINTDIYELSEQLDQKNEDEEAEKYSEFLWRMEKNDEITADERSAFIGMYRLFNQIEKSDGELIGNVLSSNEPLTLKNLLSASRSNRATGMDVSIDDDFGGLEELIQSGESISEQITAGFGTGEHRSQSYYEGLARDVFDSLTPEGLQNTEITADITLESFADELSQNAGNESYAMEYLNEQLSDIKTAAQVEDAVVKALQDYDEPVTINQLLAADMLMNQRGNAYEKLMNQSKEKSIRKEKLENAISQLQEGFNSEEEAAAAYEEMTDAAKEIVSDAKEEAEETTAIAKDDFEESVEELKEKIEENNPEA